MTFTQQMQNKHHKSGMSLIELMIVIAIMALIGAVGVPLVRGQLEKARISTTKQTLKNVQQAINMFETDIGRFPERLQDLVKKPSVSQYYEEDLISEWTTAYMKEIPKDGWKKKLKYRLTPEGTNPYELYSTGPSGKGKLNTDAISVWKK